ncbi:MAG TPA: hypothetical protein VGS07_20265 [Thermoanaerobaculia bacterium]|jgi:hypothetical protein|nr:hypothetical protein [Thermoanaerobaculia bacterium]
MGSEANASVIDFQSRFLFSFSLSSLSSAKAVSLLLGLTQADRSIWRAAPAPSTYRQEMLDASASLISAKDSVYISYLSVSPDLCNHWLRRGCQAVEVRGKAERAIASFRSADIELFLLRDGAGFISVRFRPHPEGNSYSLDVVRDFNYRVSQSRIGTRPSLRIPISDREIQLHRQAPNPESHIATRLGALGGKFTLNELIDFLLSPVSMHCDVSRQTSVYTVVRLAADVDFGKNNMSDSWKRALAGLAQIEEASHPGEKSISIPNLALNSKHWAAVSSLGAAHLIADQTNASGDPTPFNEQKMSTIMHKYFMAYALVHLQRLQVNSIRLQAQKLIDEILASSSSNSEKVDIHNPIYPRLINLRRSFSEFAVYSNLTEISNREVVNRFYDIARQGLRLDQSLGTLRDALSDFSFEHDAINSRAIADRFDHNIDTVAAVQSKLEWLEVFIASFYSTELIKMIGEASDFTHEFIAISVPFWTVASAIFVALSLRPWEHGSEKRGKSRRLVLGVVTVAFISLAIWTIAGYKTRRDEPDARHKIYQLPAEPRVTNGRNEQPSP